MTKKKRMITTGFLLYEQIGISEVNYRLVGVADLSALGGAEDEIANEFMNDGTVPMMVRVVEKEETRTLKTCLNNPRHTWLADLEQCPYCTKTQQERIEWMRKQ